MALTPSTMLALETLLPRLFAVYVGPNFVYFSISLALVGLSSGGIIVAFWEKRFIDRPLVNLARLASGFAVATFAS